MNYPLEDDHLLIRGEHSFLLIAKVLDKFALCLETSTEEYCQGVESGDVVVISAPEGGSVTPALMLAELVRTFHMPLLVMPKDHPGTRRISCVVSVAPEIHTSCAIRRGTHPEQHLICSSEELAGITIKGTDGGLDLSGIPSGICLQTLKYHLITELS